MAYPEPRLAYFDKAQLHPLLAGEDHEELRRYLLPFFGTPPHPDKAYRKDERIESVKSYIRRHWD